MIFGDASEIVIIFLCQKLLLMCLLVKKIGYGSKGNHVSWGVQDDLIPGLLDSLILFYDRVCP